MQVLSRLTDPTYRSVLALTMVIACCDHEGVTDCKIVSKQLMPSVFLED